MSQNKQAMNKLAQRVISGYEAVHAKDYAKAKQLLDPLVPMLHSETKPNIKLLSYSAIAQLGTKDVENFLETCEELKKYEPADDQEAALVQRVDDMFVMLMDTLNEEE
ncbi:MAG: hypothetical protein EA344_03605 [Alkalicoccus sp.]|nr:MAG: hypothetical protein EA344_03605 [Alkalicoccus sp.]